MLYYDDTLLASDLFTSFGLDEVERVATKDHIEILLRPGIFPGKIEVYITVDPGMQVTLASIYLDREWVGDHENVNPLGKEIVGAFLGALTPPEDAGEVAPYIDALGELRGSKDQVIVLDRDTANTVVPGEINDALEVYMGAGVLCERSFRASGMRLENIYHTGRERLRVAVEHRSPKAG